MNRLDLNFLDTVWRPVFFLQTALSPTEKIQVLGFIENTTDCFIKTLQKYFMLLNLKTK